MLNTVKCFRMLLKVSGHSGKIQDILESIQRLWKPSGYSLWIVSRHSGSFLRQSEKFLDILESSLTLKKVSGYPGKFKDNLSGKFLDTLELQDWKNYILHLQCGKKTETCKL